MVDAVIAGRLAVAASALTFSLSIFFGAPEPLQLLTGGILWLTIALHLHGKPL